MEGKMPRKRAAALASTDSEGESARLTPSKKEKRTDSDSDEDHIPLIKPRMPEPRSIFDREMLDEDTPLLSAMKKEEQREEKIMHYALDLQFWKLVPSLRGRIPGTGVMDIRHTKSQRFVFDNQSLHSNIIYPSASMFCNIRMWMQHRQKDRVAVYTGVQHHPVHGSCSCA
jgi:hypothetical protein